jgi:hypothetical protein
LCGPMPSGANVATPSAPHGSPLGFPRFTLLNLVAAPTYCSLGCELHYARLKMKTASEPIKILIDERETSRSPPLYMSKTMHEALVVGSVLALFTFTFTRSYYSEYAMLHPNLLRRRLHNPERLPNLVTHKLLSADKRVILHHRHHPPILCKWRETHSLHHRSGGLCTAIYN